MSYGNRFLSPLVLIPLLAFSASVASAQETDDECSSDADCPSGAICEKSQWTEGCSVSSEGNASDGDASDGDASECDNTVHESETGYCYVPPEQCDSDADCDEYLSCQQESTGSCWASSDGTSGCDEPDPDAPSYCAATHNECKSDSDCPREFECGESQITCATIDIACSEDDPDCGAATSTCDEEGVRECQPKEIKCEANDECPSDWSCLGTLSYECNGSTPDTGPTPVTPVDTLPVDDLGDSDGDSGSGGEDSEGSEPEEEGNRSVDPEGTNPVPLPEIDEPGDVDDDGDVDGRVPKEENEIVCVERQVVGYCAPDSWDGELGPIGSNDLAIAEGSATSQAGGTGDSGGDGDGAAAPARDSDGNSAISDDGSAKGESSNGSDSGGAEEAEDSDGGCSLAAGPQAPASPAWFLGLLLLVPGLRRRIRAGEPRA